MKKLIFLALFSCAIVFGSNQNQAHRLSANAAGLWLVLGYGLSPGLSYEWAFHRNFALEVEANYNYSIFALGQGPCNSVGVDLFIEAMVYNFGEKDFSKGFGFSLGTGNHYMADYNQGVNQGKRRDYYIGTISIGLFYYHLFDNNFFIKTGLKAPAIQNTVTFDKTYGESKPRLIPKIFFSLGYAF